MSLSATIAEAGFLKEFRGFLLSILPGGVEVIRSQANRVPEPKGPNFVMMTLKSRSRQATNENSWDVSNADPTTLELAQSTRVTVQLDFHGPAGSDYAQMFATVWRDAFACNALDGSGIQPLWADDGRQVPFINGEGQYEDRWVMDVAFQVNPVVSTPQQFAAILSIDTRGLP